MPWTSIASAVSVVFPADPRWTEGKFREGRVGCTCGRGPDRRRSDRDSAIAPRGGAAGQNQAPRVGKLGRGGDLMLVVRWGPGGVGRRVVREARMRQSAVV